jgi:dinuclear metal center YbgI/SA1388 family protein
MKLSALVRQLDALFAPVKVNDVAINGLQVGGDWEVPRVALVVDARLSVFQEAARQGCGLVIAHHGLFWGNQFPLVGGDYQRLAFLVNHQLALYAQHLPLDMHPTLGNNALLMSGLGLPVEGAFGNWHGNQIGYFGALPSPRPLQEYVEEAKTRLHLSGRLLPFGSPLVTRVGVVSGGPGYGDILDAKHHGIDLVITGETNHAVHALAQDWGMNVLFCGHYATETFGVGGLGGWIEKELGLPTVFLPEPTDM